MSRRLAAIRLLIAVAAVSALAACASPTAPTTNHDGDTGCRSGWILSNGVCQPQ